MNNFGLPDVSDALDDLSTQVRLRVVEKAAQDYEITEKEKAPIIFYGVLNPLPQKLNVKPEGQRKWRSWNLFTTKELELDWMIEDPVKNKFRVFEKESWGYYFRYIVLENPLTA